MIEVACSAQILINILWMALSLRFHHVSDMTMITSVYAAYDKQVLIINLSDLTSNDLRSILRSNPMYDVI